MSQVRYNLGSIITYLSCQFGQNKQTIEFCFLLAIEKLEYLYFHIADAYYIVTLETKPKIVSKKPHLHLTAPFYF